MSLLLEHILLSFDKRKKSNKWHKEYSHCLSILYYLKSREWWVVRNNSAVWSGFDPRPVISVHMKSGLVTTNFVPNHSSPVLDNFRETVICAVSRGDAPVEDVVSVRRTGEHTGVVVITSSHIYFCQWKFYYSIWSCYWLCVIMNTPNNPCRAFFWNGKKYNRILNFWKKPRIITILLQ